MANHDKKTFANEYLLCRRIPHRWIGNLGQLQIGNMIVGYETIFTIYNCPYSDVVSWIDSICEYDEAGYFCGLKEKRF